jgi:flavin-dependent dehydrogenase
LRIVSRFVVDATGRHAELCRRLGIGRRREDRLIGIAGILWAEEALGEPLPSRIEAHPLGWWYSAGLPGGCVIAVFFTDADLSARTRLANPRAWRRLLGESRHTFDRLAACIPCGSIRVFPATSHCLDCAAGASWLAVGDALIGRDPLSSSGIDFALASAERASSVLCALANGNEESAATYNAQVSADFAAYMRQRRAHYAIESRWPNSPFWQRRHPSSADGESPKYGTELA